MEPDNSGSLKKVTDWTFKWQTANIKSTRWTVDLSSPHQCPPKERYLGCSCGSETSASLGSTRGSGRRTAPPCWPAGTPQSMTSCRDDTHTHTHSPGFSGSGLRVVCLFVRALLFQQTAPRHWWLLSSHHFNRSGKSVCHSFLLQSSESWQIQTD